MHPKGEYLAAADDSGAVKIYSTSTRRVHKTLRNAHTVRVTDGIGVARISRSWESVTAVNVCASGGFVRTKHIASPLSYLFFIACDAFLMRPVP